MATRYYTEEAFEQIKQTIEQIDNTDVNRVMDFFDDLFQRLAQFLEFYSVDNYKDDMQKWYDKVLDSHNSTMSEIGKIFNAVDTLDFEYRDNIMSGAINSIVNFRSTLNCLRDVISGKSSLAEGKAAADEYVTAGASSLNASCDKILTKMQQRTLWDASKELFGDAIKLGAGYNKCVYGGGNIADYKNLGDTILATGCDLLSIAAIVIAPLGALGDALDGKMDMSYEDYIDAQFILLSPAQKLKDVNSVSDLLDNLAEDMGDSLADCPKDSPCYDLKQDTEYAELCSLSYDALKARDGKGRKIDPRHAFADMINNSNYISSDSSLKNINPDNIRLVDNLSGLQCFILTEGDKAVVVFVGTNGDIGDYVADAKLTFSGTPQQAREARELIDKISNDYEHIVVTGHSLGGYLATDVTLNNPNVTECVAFDPPGRYDMLLQEGFNKEHTSKITTYQAKGSLISSVGGDPYDNTYSVDVRETGNIVTHNHSIAELRNAINREYLSGSCNL